jgi:class 3 adenylate cyclase/predicted ATPase
MHCPGCGAITPGGKKFCGHCGAALPLVCPACGSENSAKTRFCGDCGASLTSKGGSEISVGRAVEPLRPTETDAERRHLTVMFCDLVGSTVLAGELDPEDLAGVIRRFQAICTSTLENAAGHVARFMGDGVLAYFGYPHAHEDDAERAVRAGLELVAKIGQLLLPSGEPLQVRVGIATGLVVVGETLSEGPAQEQAAVGITPNLAARLQTEADPNTVLVAESTHRLLGNLFVYEGVRSYQLKGFADPVSAWRVVGERVVDSRFDARRSGTLTRFVGRQHELRQLLGLWERSKRGECHVALLCGEAGIGKSRVSKTLRDCLDTCHLKIEYQCSPHHTNSPFHPVVKQLEHAAGFESGDTPDIKLSKLKSALAPAGQETLADIGLYAALLSIPTGEPNSKTDVTPQRQKDLTIDALIRQLLALARKSPVLFILEDVHWIDPTTLELVNRTIQSIKTAPALFLLTFRPDFLPPWLDQPHVTMLRLEKLSRDQAGSMILEVTGGKQIPDEVYDQIIGKTDGVPLFIEELTKAVLESGLLRYAGDRYVIDGPLPPLAIPTTLHDSLMARLDRFAPVKEIAQIGAVLGREFSYRLIAAVARTSTAFLQSALSQLTEAELIFERGERPDAVYVFKHALVQDAAYESLLRSKRQQLHNRIANVLKEQFAETIEQQPELMAHHLLQAGLTEPAIAYLQKAAQRAIQRSANTEAIGHLKQALESLHSLPKNRERARTELELEVMLGQAMIAGRGYAAHETKEVLLRAKGLIDESTAPAQKFAILYGIWACYYVGGEGGTLRAAADDFLAEAEHHNDSAALCLSHRTLGTTLVTMGDFVGGRRHLERARELYDPVNHTPLRYQYGQDIGATALCYLCWALWHLGYVEQSASVSSEAMAIAEALSHPHTLAYTICHARGMLDVCRRRTEDMQSYARVAAAVSTDHGFPFWAAGGRILEGWAIACRGQADRGIEMLEEGLSAWRATGARLWLPIFLALKAQAQAKGGHIEAALQTIEQAITVSNETRERWAIAEVLRLKADLLLAAGRATPSAIEALLVDSLEIARGQKARSWQLRTACDLACLWQGQGRREDAVRLLQASYDQFTEGFETPDLACARILLDQLLCPNTIDQMEKVEASMTRNRH